MTGLTCRRATARATGTPPPASARGRRRPARSRPARRRTRTTRACAPRRRSCRLTDAPVLMAAVPRSQKASAPRTGVRGRSTSARTASCSPTTRATSPPSWTSTSRGHSRLISPKKPCRWYRATCRRPSSTRRRRARHAASTSTTTTPGTSTTPGTGTRRTGTRQSTTRRRRRRPRRRTTWRRPATRRCCWAARRCTRSTSPWSGSTGWSTRRTTRRTPRTPRTPRARPTPTPRYLVWKRRCRTRPKTCTGSERRPQPALQARVPTTTSIGTSTLATPRATAIPQHS